MVESGLKNGIIIVLIMLSAILFLVAVGSSSNANRQRASRDNEMATRLDLEEKLNNLNREKADLGEKLSKVRTDLAAEEASHQAAKKELAEVRERLQELRGELEKISALKDARDATWQEELSKSNNSR